MNKQILVVFLSLCFVSAPVQAEITETFGSGANQFNMIFEPIGNPNNTADTTGSPNPSGSVGYHYNMGKYEVSRDMIIKANAAGNLGITLQNMTVFGGNGANRPATGVSWNEAARYVNWLNTSQGYWPAYKFAAQPGQPGYGSNSQAELWQLGDPGYNPANPLRNTQARYFLPSVDEWYKAAYYDPHANGGAGGYWNFPTGSDMAPTPVTSGTTAGTAVYNRSAPADIDNAGGLSPYGVMGMGGNAVEWEETTVDLLNSNPSSDRGLRGGSWDAVFPNTLAATVRINTNPTNENHTLGFRVASFPELAEVVGAFVFHAGFSGSGTPPWNAIDSDKTLAKEGSGPQTINLSNVSNTLNGINGLVFDIQNLANRVAVSPSDFAFQVSPTGAFDPGVHPPVNWQTAVTPSVTVLPGSPDRVLIQWPNQTIMNRYLRVTILGNPNTGLPADEVYYVGHLLGETTGGTEGNFTVAFADISPIRAEVGQNVDASSVMDIDKNGAVSFADISAMRSNVGVQLPAITIP